MVVREQLGPGMGNEAIAAINSAGLVKDISSYPSLFAYLSCICKICKIICKYI
jgi:hypothetical protein